MVPWRGTWCHGGVRGAMEGYLVPWRGTWCHGGVHGAMEGYMVPLTSNRSKVTVDSDTVTMVTMVTMATRVSFDLKEKSAV